MSVTVTAYFDFRSPYAYFADHRLRDGTFRPELDISWDWRPVSIDVLLNLQAGRQPWAAYADPLAPPKRAHLIADVRRMSQFYGVPLRPPNPARPNSIPALAMAASLQGDVAAAFRRAVFDALWRDQRDIGDPAVLAELLGQGVEFAAALEDAFSARARDALAEATAEAYAGGIFGVPTFVSAGRVFFGADRLDVLGWQIEREARQATP